MRPSNEPFFWAIFSAGGVIIALLLPVLIVITGFIIPAEEITFSRIENVFGNPLIRLIVLGVSFLTFFHAAHRIRHTLKDLGLRRISKPISVGSYLIAGAGTIWAAAVIV